MSGTSEKLTTFLRKMSKKGFFAVLKYVSEKSDIHYNEILRYALATKIVNSRSSVTVILNTLSDMGVVDRNVSVGRPIRTTYKVNKKGRAVIQYLQQIEKDL